MSAPKDNLPPGARIMKFEFARLRDERHPIAAPKRRAGRKLFKEALQTAADDLPDVFWIDGIMIVVEP